MGLQPGPPVRHRVGATAGRTRSSAFVRDAHARGIAVIVDVVYNHLGPSDLDLWRFDGWAEGDGGGIYFYNDERGVTPWGATRPDYGRGEVRTFLRDSAMTWLEEFRCDGLRFDSTVHIRTVDGYPASPASGRCPTAGRSWPGSTTRSATRQPWKITIAEDLAGRPDADDADRRRAAPGSGPSGTPGSSAGSGRSSSTDDDAERDIGGGRRGHRRRGPRRRRCSRVIYTESHDEVANGLVRVPEAIAPGDADSWWAKKRADARLGAGPDLARASRCCSRARSCSRTAGSTTPSPLDWDKASSNRGILRLHRDLIALRRARDGATRGLRGSNVAILRADQEAKLLAMHRWMDGGPHDDTVVVANFADRTLDDLALGFPAPGRWNVRFNSDASALRPRLRQPRRVRPRRRRTSRSTAATRAALVSLGPYSVVILSRES